MPHTPGESEPTNAELQLKTRVDELLADSPWSNWHRAGGWIEGSDRPPYRFRSRATSYMLTKLVEFGAFAIVPELQQDWNSDIRLDSDHVPATKELSVRHTQEAKPKGLLRQTPPQITCEILRVTVKYTEPQTPARPPREPTKDEIAKLDSLGYEWHLTGWGMQEFPEHHYSFHFNGQGHPECFSVDHSTIPTANPADRWGDDQNMFRAHAAKALRYLED